MRALNVRHTRSSFWEEYWERVGVDLPAFVDLDIYPIQPTLRYVDRSMKILECGFGGGRVVRHLHGQGYDIRGIEYDQAAVDRLLAEDPSLQVARGDIRALDFPDGFFDVSLCFGVIGGMREKTGQALQELRRVTRSGGVLVVSVTLDNMARLAQRALDAMARGPREFLCWMDSAPGWAAYFTSLGLDVVESEPVVSRYNLWFKAPFLRAGREVDLRLARVKDDAYALNGIGNFLWWAHKRFLRRALAAAEVYVLRNQP